MYKDEYAFYATTVVSSDKVNTMSLRFRKLAGVMQAIKKSRPWKTKDQFDKEIGKNVGPKESARLWRYVVIQ